jgi:hypothetical protein
MSQIADIRNFAIIAHIDHGKSTLADRFLELTHTVERGDHDEQLASFLKSERMELDEQEIAHTLQSQMKYGKDDIVIVDWDGAVVFEPSGNVEPIVELFQVANLQLLQYRVLHDDLDYRLRKVDNNTLRSFFTNTFHILKEKNIISLYCIKNLRAFVCANYGVGSLWPHTINRKKKSIHFKTFVRIKTKQDKAIFFYI